MCWGVYASVHAGIHPLGVGLGDPLGVGLETPLQARPLNFPPRCKPGDPPPGQTPQLPPGCGTGDPPQGQTPQPPPPQGVGLETCQACWDTTPPPCEQND